MIPRFYCSTDLLNPQDDLKRITACVSDIRTWMIQNKLKINEEKTEFLILHLSYKEFTANLNFEIGQTLVKPSDTCRNLGVIFDSHMKMENQIQSICQSVNFHLRSINSVRDSLTDEATVHWFLRSIIRRKVYVVKNYLSVFGEIRQLEPTGTIL